MRYTPSGQRFQATQADHRPDVLVTISKTAWTRPLSLHTRAYESSLSGNQPCPVFFVFPSSALNPNSSALCGTKHRRLFPLLSQAKGSLFWSRLCVPVVILESR